MSSQHISQFAAQLSKLSTRFHEELEIAVKALDNQVADLSGQVETLTALLGHRSSNGYDSPSLSPQDSPSHSRGFERLSRRLGESEFDRKMIGGQKVPRAMKPHSASSKSRNVDPGPLLLRGLCPLRESNSEIEDVASRCSSANRVRITELDVDDGDIASDGEEFSYQQVRESERTVAKDKTSEKSWTCVASDDVVGGGQSYSTGSPFGQKVSNRSSENSSQNHTMSQSVLLGNDERRFTDNSQTTGGGSIRRIGNKFSIDEVFPPWFNPFVQETYVGKREGGHHMGSTIMAAIRLRTTTGGIDVEEPVGLCCVLSPMGRPVMVWTMVWVAALSYDIWVTPLESAFVDEEHMPAVYRHLAYVILVFFCMDIILNFFMGYLDGEIEVLDHVKIAQAYLKGWFWIDVAATTPWHMIFDVSRGVSAGRAAKAFKAMKVVKTLRILKMFKYNRMIRHAKLNKYQRAISKALSKKDTTYTKMDSRLEMLHEKLQVLETYCRPMVLPFKAILIVATLAHAHSAFYALSNGWTPSMDIGLGFDRYYRSLRWYFSLLTFGSFTTTCGDHHGLSDDGVLEMVVLVERLILVTLFLSRITFGTLVLQQEEAKIQMKYADTMDYLRSHDVSARTRAQVRFNVKETGKHRAVHQHFLDLMHDNLPEHLQSQICKELWAKHLVTFGLFNEISKWNEDFIGELCLIVTEKSYASKVVVFQENDAVNEALMVLKGKLSVKSTFQKDSIPSFTDGMWIGEKGLINIGLRRSGTCVTDTMSNVMTVPVYGFQFLLDRLGVLNRFQEFCCNELWRGLCGRCGKMSDHFSNTCPMVCRSTPHAHKSNLRHILSPAATARFGSMSMGLVHRCASMSLGFPTQKEHGRISEVGSTETLSSSKNAIANIGNTRLAHDTKLFLTFHNLQMIAPDLERNGVVTLDDLSTFFATRKHDYDASVAGPEVIRAFREDMANETKRMLSLRMSQHDYFVFVSHFKVEAGTEAALIRAELQQLIDEDEGHPAKDLHTAIFLDAEDLKDLGILLKAVMKSHNMMLLLTPGVLTRPWCLMEIAAAVRANVNLLPVLITKPGCEFVFPDEKFYSEFLAGATVGEGGVKEVQKQGFEMTEICKALRKIFETIAMPYSPHRTASIRYAECKGILSRCTCRAINKESYQGRRPTLISAPMAAHSMQPGVFRDPRAASTRRGSTASLWELTSTDTHIPIPKVPQVEVPWFSPRNRAVTSPG